MLIASATNPKIKYLLKLRKKSFRNSEGVFLIEGARELERAIASEFELRSIFFCRSTPKSAKIPCAY